MTKQSIHDIYKQHSVFSEEVRIAVIQQYSPITKQWKFVQYRCLLCDSPFKSTNRVEHHKAICKAINTTKKEKEMPIQVITVKGERMYRWGDTGKLYRNRADAEKQAAAAYASGYKEKKDMKQK
jgi:hypothetical protein